MTPLTYTELINIIKTHFPKCPTLQDIWSFEPKPITHKLLQKDIIHSIAKYQLKTTMSIEDYCIFLETQTE